MVSVSRHRSRMRTETEQNAANNPEPVLKVPEKVPELFYPFASRSRRE